ncbi:hypothetical protein [Algivirga pacifica]|uniref:UbiA prenyltransferase family protein n=1 Tax=Algivirga pacifica TaxID=1162670 RepID=A0ABP9CWW3_9BACT
MVGECYRFLQVLSLDVVLGAMICSAFLASVLEVQLEVVVYIVLGLAVWIIYTLDHLLDAKAIQHKAHTYRHHFHQRYAKPLWWSILLASILEGVLLFYIPPTVFWMGIKVSILVAVYFLMLQFIPIKAFLLKELSIAIIYVIGILVGPLSEVSVWHWEWTALVLQLFLLAYINLLEFSLYDEKTDQLDGHKSAVSCLGKWRIKKLLLAVFFSFLIISLGVLWKGGETYPLWAQSILWAMGIVLYLVFELESRLKQRQLYRVLGDAVFLFPAVYLFFE